MSRPSNAKEWSLYIGKLSGQPLYSQAVAANSHDFGRALLEEGATQDDVEADHLMFVIQCKATGTKVPFGGVYDMVNMSLTHPTARTTPVMSEEEADFLEATQKTTGSDDFDMFELEASLDL